MTNKCINLRIRQKKYVKYFYCLDKRHIISLVDCNNCLKRNLVRNKTIKKVSKKQSLLEKERDKNLIKKGKCQYCGKYSDRLDPHEVYRWK